MEKIARKLTDLIGNTPLLELSNYNKSNGLKARLIVKIESFNPAGSVKDRVALAMIEDAEVKGVLHFLRHFHIFVIEYRDHARCPHLSQDSYFIKFSHIYLFTIEFIFVHVHSHRLRPAPRLLPQKPD